MVQSLLASRSLARRLPGLMLVMLSGLVGCSRAPIPSYVLSEQTKALPDLHQKQMQEALTTFFGTSTNPRLMNLAPESEESTDETGDAAAEDAGAADSSAEGEAAADAKKTPTPATGSSLKLAEVVAPAHLRNGAKVYRQVCVGCHGVSGDGNGVAAAYLVPKPRDYRKGIFKFTSTPYGMKPVRADLVRTIRRGAKGTSMPAFPWMSEEDLSDVIDYVILLSQRGEVENFVGVIAGSDYEEDQRIEDADFAEALETVATAWKDAESNVILPVTAEPAYNEESITLGRQAFLSRGCSKCHGEDGKGQTEWLSSEFLAAQAAAPEEKRIQINYDAWGQPAPAADLTARMLHGGRRPLDIYRRIHKGITGTPMPAFGDALKEEPETVWHLVHFVLGIVEGHPAALAKSDASAAPASTDPASDAAPAETAPAPEATSEGESTQTSQAETVRELQAAS